MTPSDQPGPVICPHCGAENRVQSSQCYLCHQSLKGGAAAPPSQLILPPAAPRHGPRFSILSIMLLIALVAVYLGLFRVAPGVAAMLLIPGGIALVRTINAADRAGRETPMWFDHLAVFLATFAAVMGFAVAVVGSAFVSCLGVAMAVGDDYDGLIAGLLVGAVVGVGVLIGLSVAIARASRKKRNP